MLGRGLGTAGTGRIACDGGRSVDVSLRSVRCKMYGTGHVQKTAVTAGARCCEAVQLPLHSIRIALTPREVALHAKQAAIVWSYARYFRVD